MVQPEAAGNGSLRKIIRSNRNRLEIEMVELLLDIIADTAAGFWGTKSHSSLGRFLHAPLRPC